MSAARRHGPDDRSGQTIARSSSAMLLGGRQLRVHAPTPDSLKSPIEEAAQQ